MIITQHRCVYIGIELRDSDPRKSPKIAQNRTLKHKNVSMFYYFKNGLPKALRDSDPRKSPKIAQNRTLKHKHFSMFYYFKNGLPKALF